MSFFDLAKDALKEIPMADIMRARLELAFDQSALQEKQMSTLRDENAELKAELKIAQRDVEKKSAEFEALKKEHEEEVVVLDAVKFRRGKRTLSRWMPFCPVCDLPLDVDRERRSPVQCLGSRKCDWYYQHSYDRYLRAVGELPK